MNEIAFRISWAKCPEGVEFTQVVNYHHDQVITVCILQLITSSIDCISFDCSYANFQWLSTFIVAKLCKTTYRCRQSIYTVEHTINICFNIFAWEHTCCYGNKPTHLSISHVLREVHLAEAHCSLEWLFTLNRLRMVSTRGKFMHMHLYTHTLAWFSPTSLRYCALNVLLSIVRLFFYIAACLLLHSLNRRPLSCYCIFAFVSIYFIYDVLGRASFVFVHQPFFQLRLFNEHHWRNGYTENMRIHFCFHS